MSTCPVCPICRCNALSALSAGLPGCEDCRLIVDPTNAPFVRTLYRLFDSPPLRALHNRLLGRSSYPVYLSDNVARPEALAAYDKPCAQWPQHGVSLRAETASREVLAEEYVHGFQWAAGFPIFGAPYPDPSFFLNDSCLHIGMTALMSRFGLQIDQQDEAHRLFLRAIAERLQRLGEPSPYDIAKHSVKAFSRPLRWPQARQDIEELYRKKLPTAAACARRLHEATDCVDWLCARSYRQGLVIVSQALDQLIAQQGGSPWRVHQRKDIPLVLEKSQENDPLATHVELAQIDTCAQGLKQCAALISRADGSRCGSFTGYPEAVSAWLSKTFCKERSLQHGHLPKEQHDLCIALEVMIEDVSALQP